MRDGAFSFMLKKALSVGVSLCLVFGCSPMAYAYGSPTSAKAYSLNVASVNELSSAIDYSTSTFTTEINCASAEYLKLYVLDEDSHLAIVGNNDTQTYENGLVAPDGVGEIDEVVVPASVTDDSGVQWTIKAIGAHAFHGTGESAHYVKRITIKAQLDYIGSKAFSPGGAYYNEANVDVRFVDGGHATSVVADAYSYMSGDIAYPEGMSTLVVYGTKNSEKKRYALSGTSLGSVAYPVSANGEIWNTSSSAGLKLCVKSPYLTFRSSYSISTTGSSFANIYYWPKSKTYDSITSNLTKAKYYKAMPMGVISSNGWTLPEQYVPADETEYKCPQNVTFPVVEGETYTFNPTQLVVTSDDGCYSWEPVLGDDYTVAYADASGNALEGEPTEAGTYRVKFIGNSSKAAQTVWGESDWITYNKIDPDISKAELSYDEGATTFRYDATAHAPDIKVTSDGIELEQDDLYRVTYFSDDDGTASLKKPTKSGSYRALVISKPPATGVAGIVPFTIEPVEIKSATATNIEAGAVGAPTVTVCDASGAVIDPRAYKVTYYKQGDAADEVSELSAAGSYKAVVTGDKTNEGGGCLGNAEAEFTVVAGGSTLKSATQTAELTYTGEALSPMFEVKDANDIVVDETNYGVSIATNPESGEGEVVSKVVAAGKYTATFTARGNSYIGETTCDFSVAASEIDVSKVHVTLNRDEYDYIPSAFWADENATYTEGQRIIHRGEAIEPDVTVTYDGKPLVKGTDYALECENNTGSDEKYNSKEDVTNATFSVKLIGDYNGELKSGDYKYTIKKRAHSCTYKGIKFAFALDNNGKAVITGLDMDMDYTTENFSQAYNLTEWDHETFTVPATVKEGESTYSVVRIADNAFQPFSAPVLTSNSSSSSQDLLNGSTKLVIEQGIKEIGQHAFTCNKLTDISLPEGIEVLHAGCLFGGMMNTTKITIPSSVTTMGHCVFGQNLRYSNVEEIEFVQPSRVMLSNEPMESSGTDGNDKVVHSKQTGVPFWGGGDVSGEEKYPAPIEEITLPATFTANRYWFTNFGNLKNAYCMAGTYTNVYTPGVGGAPGATLWNWDTKDNPFPGAIENGVDAKAKSMYSTFRPFAVLGDGYTYKNALNPDTGVCNAEVTYPGNVQVGTSVVTNAGDKVSVAWDLQQNFANSEYAWMPAEGEDFTVSYVDVDGNAVESITQLGTYTATLTGNEKTCYGTTTATVTVGAAAIENSGVKLESTSLTYNGAAQEPAVTVELADGARLAAGTDYDVSYANNRTVGTGTVTVTGKGFYAGSVASAEFAITPATLTVTGVDASKTYGGSDPTLKCTISGLVGGDKARGYEVSREAGENPRTYAVTPTGVFVFDADGNYATGNYNVKYVNGTFTVKKIQIAVPTGKSLPFTGGKRTGVAKGTGYSLSGTTTGTNVGEYTAKATCDATHVFKDGKTTASVKWNITQAANTATAAKTSVTLTQKVANLSKKAGTVALPKVTTKFGTGTWKVSTKDAKGVLTLKSGKVQVKKGAKAGKYTLKLKASVTATKNYKAATTKVVTVTVTVKK